MKRGINILFLGGIVAWSLGPFIWLWNTSFKDPVQATQLPPIWFSGWNFGNYLSVLENETFLRVIWNSLAISLGTTAVSLVVGSLGAFGISRLMKKNQNIVLLGLLIVFMIPQVAVVTPFYKFMVHFHLKDTILGLILAYSVFAVPLVVWVLFQVFEEYPQSLYHAARVDGCGNWKIFTRIYLPLGASGLVSAGLLCVIFCWNEFLFALTFTSTWHSRTIPVGITLFSGQYAFPWGEISAASSLVTFPILLIIVAAQKYLVRGLIGSSLKE